MASEILKRDQNHVTVLGGVTNDVDMDVTMLRVDPISKRLLVAATGTSGGSGYQAPLSGGLTGTNTWTTAPNAIAVDGAVKQKVSTDGTVNWTGTTTTTLTVQPTFDVFGLA